ncbi:conjugative transposon protein TraM [Algoriphagus resistens]|uniref:conjugative transposon protein TraM n=1 Tax=Algoriphagus resistens TaxID=1750590 RepID=UPI0007168A5F|nr:conjugative transposon protein TraM [Algoriphagus resistens]
MQTNPIDPHDAQLHRKGIFYLILPLIVLPVLFGLSWILLPVQAETFDANRGLNTALPAPQIKQEKATKAAAYALMEQEKKQVPKADLELPALYSSLGSEAELPEKPIELAIPEKFLEKESRPGSSGDPVLHEQERLIHQRIEEIDKLISEESDMKLLNKGQSKGLGYGSNPRADILSKPEVPEISAELLEMQELMAGLESASNQPDVQLKQLSEIMDKLLELQNPELAESRKNEQPIVLKERAFPALKKGQLDSSSSFVADESLGRFPVEIQNGFYGLSDELPGEHPGGIEKSTFSAIVPRTQEIYPGDALEIKLEESLWVNGKEIPAGTSLFGKTSLSSNRLLVGVSGLVLDSELIALDLTVYSLDAMAGLPVNAKSAGGKALEGSQNELQSIGMMGMGMDWQAQVANSGIQATKGLLKSGSKAKQITVKAGHPLFLINSTQTR